MIGQSKTKTMEILLVEDGLMDARVTIHALRRSGIHHRVTLVRTFNEAVRFLKREGIFVRAPRPDLMLLDMMLPDGSGVDILEAMDEIQGQADRTTVVVMTASDDDAIRNRCQELGVYDFITKPVSEDKFLHVVREHKVLMVHEQRVMAQA